MSKKRRSIYMDAERIGDDREVVITETPTGNYRVSFIWDNPPAPDEEYRVTSFTTSHEAMKALATLCQRWSKKR